MTVFVIAVATVLVVSALCSLSEAALYSVRMPYIRQLVDSGSRAGQVLAGFKQNMDRPITAILIVNTAANTAGASVAGAQARGLFGEGSLIWFSLLFTLSVLFFSEILPKVAGVTYRRAVSHAASIPLDFLIRLLTPLVWLSRQATRLFQHDQPQPFAPEDEVHQIAMMSAEEGSILPIEADLVQNVLRLNDVTAREIMTPRTVVFKLEASRTVRDVADEVARMPISRIPLYHAADPEHWIGWVLRSEVLACLARDEFATTLDALSKPLGFVPEVVPGHRLLSQFLKRRTHILAVLDEYGGVLGVVTLEDVMESLLGQEIVDETDLVVDLQDEARQQGRQRLGQPEEDDGLPSSPGSAGAFSEEDPGPRED